MNLLRVAVIGAGAWGTSLADFLAEVGHEVTLWVLEEDLCGRMRESRENDIYLPDISLHSAIRYTSDLAEAASAGQDLLLSVVPSQFLGPVWERLAHSVHEGAIIVSATKGIDEKSLALPTELIEGIIKGNGMGNPIVCISGPTFARELAMRKPTAITAVSVHAGAALKVQEALSALCLRVYTGSDPIGAQLGGALKNVIALAAGVADGMELGYNTRAALIVRGLAETSRLCAAMGGRMETLAGLAGMGDLVLTCTGDLSRNRTVGLRLGRGEKLREILASMRAVAEGVTTAHAAVALGKKFQVEMPISAQIHQVLFEDKDPVEALSELMARPLKAEGV
ncbi:NAD(P)H-dependent glycerol-3-phosphate dehydrogenase [Nitrospinota bacterium]